MLGTIDIDGKQNRLYLDKSKSKRFETITDEVEEKISELVDSYNKHYEKTHGSMLKKNLSVKYAACLDYLNNSRDLSYDEKIVFLIKMFDPELKANDIYLSYDFFSNSKIKEEENDYVKQSMIDENERLITELNIELRATIGIADIRLAENEGRYLKKRRKELQFNIKRNYVTTLLNYFKKNIKVLDITKQEMNTAFNLAYIYRKKYGTPSINDISYQIVNQSNLLKLENFTQKFLFMVYVLDLELKAVDIYENNGKWDAIKTECKEKLGFFEEEFVLLEALYDKKVKELKLY